MAFFDRQIRAHFDRHFFDRLPEVIDGAFASAHLRALNDGRSLAMHIPYVRGTDRFYAVQQGVMQVAVESGAEPITVHAGNFPMALARHKRFLVATSITDSLEHLRRSPARKLLASLNACFEPYQQDLWEERPPITDGMFFGMVLIAKSKDQRSPAGIFFGVPSSTLRSWHFYADIMDVAEMFGTSAAVAPQRKGPTLRSVPRSATVVRRLPGKRP